MSSSLKLDWCSHAAAKYAVEHWHYSRSLPPPPCCRVGVWESGRFIGCVLFGRGATQNLLKPFSIQNTEGCELVRVAMDRHKAPVSRMLAIACKMLSRSQPGLRLIISFADPSHEHVGGIYQASGWFYLGRTAASSEYRDKAGRIWHERMVSPSGRTKVFGRYRSVVTPSECTRIKKPGKHRYAMPLDAAMRSQLLALAQPYPKRAGSADSGTPGDQPGGGGATPTSALCGDVAVERWEKLTGGTAKHG